MTTFVLADFTFISIACSFDIYSNLYSPEKQDMSKCIQTSEYKEMYLIRVDKPAFVWFLSVKKKKEDCIGKICNKVTVKIGSVQVLNDPHFNTSRIPFQSQMVSQKEMKYHLLVKIPAKDNSNVFTIYL